MLFQSKVDRAMEYQARQKAAQGDRAEEPSLKEGMEKGDLPAMILSALLVLVPVGLGALLLICGVGWLFMCR